MTAAVRGPGLDLLGQLADLVLDSWLDQPTLRIYNADQLAERVAAEGANHRRGRERHCGGQLFEQPLLAVASCRGDPNNVDVAAATAAGVPVLRAPGRNADAVAELAVALLFAATRGVVAADRDVRAGRHLQGRHHPLPALPGLGAGRAHGRAGRAGGGRAGAALAPAGPGPGGPRLRPLRARRHLAASTSCSSRSDVVSMHAPVTAETAGMIGAAQFARMRDGVVFLNTARAQLHDTDALVAALQSGKVAAAGLDHFEGEWLDPDHPLAELDSVVLTPHIGGATYDTETNHTRTIAEDLCRLLAGARPLHIVNPEVLGQT